MFEDEPLIARENQGLGCPMLDALPHRHIVDGDALIDTAGACVVTRASKRPPATPNLSISYLAAGRVGPIRAEAAALRIGRHHGV